jgi:prepilin-type processing-associated H-X9-DG protein
VTNRNYPQNWHNKVGLINPNHNDGGEPAGGNVGYVDAHVSWVNQQDMDFYLPGFNPYDPKFAY